MVADNNVRFFFSDGSAERFETALVSVKDHRKLLIDEPAAIVVKRIFGYAAESILPTQIAKTLNSENIPTPQQRKKELGFQTQKSA